MTKKSGLGNLYIIRHAAAEQERLDPQQLEGLSRADFRARIRDLNMRQSLTAEGRRQARRLGEFLTGVINDIPVAVVGPYRRHQETAAEALSHFPGLQPLTDERLAERSRGQVDPSVMPARRMKDEMPEEYNAKTSRPASWRPGALAFPDDPDAWGENYPMVNERVREVWESALRKAGQSIIFFTSGEVCLASLHKTGFGPLDDDGFRNGIVTPSGVVIPTMTFENGGIVAYGDPDGLGRYTHFRIVQPDCKAKDPYHGANTIDSGLMPI